MLNNILTNVFRKNFAVILIAAMFLIGNFFVATPVFAAPAPTVTSISPSSGTTAGGTSVTIGGTGFLTSPTVTIGGNAATNVVRLSSLQITATTPAGTAGAQNVKVTNADTQSGTLTAGFTYVASSHTITASAGANGSISPSVAVSVSDGASQSFTIAADANYHIADVLVDSVSAGAVTSYNFTNVIADHTIAASFGINTYTLTYTAGANGSITGTSPQTVNSGSNGTAVTAVPAAGYHFVNWSDALTVNPRTDTNVTTNISVTANFAVVSSETAAPVASVIIQKTVVHFFGRAYPGAIITLLEKSGSQETPVQQTKTASSDGSFSVKIEGFFAGYYSYGLKVADKDGRLAPIKFYDMDIGPSSVNERNIFIPPTLGLAKQVVFQGDEATLLGYATPKSELKAEVDGKSLGKFAVADASGFYRLAINTQNLSQGSHTARVRQSDASLGVESDWSISPSFIISTSAKIKADFNNDGKVGIADWSIFLFRWGSRDQKLRSAIDMDGNGKIDVIDLSIFLKTMQI